MVDTLDGNVNVNVNLAAAPPAGVNFGIPLIVGPATDFDGDVVRSYSTPAAATSDTAALGATLTAMVIAAFSQLLKVSTVKVGDLNTLTVDVWNVDITAGTTGDSYQVTILGEIAIYVMQAADTAADIVDGLILAVTALALPVATVDNGDDFDITGTGAGQALAVAVTSSDVVGNLAAVNTTPAVTYATELALIAADDDDWYGLDIVSRSEIDILSAAAYAEPRPKLFVAQSADVAILTSVATDLASLLQALAYTKTALLYHPTATEYGDVAWLSNRSSVNPDRATTIWRYVTLQGVTQQKITDTQLANLRSKNCNVYSTMNKTGATDPGVVASGDKIDLIITGDWLEARIAEALMTNFSKQTNLGLKIAYDTGGITALAGVIRGVLDLGVDVKHLSSDFPPVLTIPKIEDISAVDRAARVIAFTFTADPAGAIELAQDVTGYIAVTVEP